MTLRHVIDYYMDGYKAIAFCKVCSKEDQQLLEPCTGQIDTPLYFRDMSKKEFDEKYSKALDESKKAAK